MLVGHFDVAFVGKRVEPELSLGTLVLAAMHPYCVTHFTVIPCSHFLLIQPQKLR